MTKNVYYRYEIGQIRSWQIELLFRCKPEHAVFYCKLERLYLFYNNKMSDIFDKIGVIFAEGIIIQIENLFNYLSENNSYFIKNVGQFIIIKQI